MKRRLLAWTLTSAILAAALASPASAAAPAGGSGSTGVTITASDNASISCALTGAESVGVRSNVPWRLTFETAKGRCTIAGPNTGETAVTVAIPAGTSSWSASLDR